MRTEGRKKRQKAFLPSHEEAKSRKEGETVSTTCYAAGRKQSSRLRYILVRDVFRGKRQRIPRVAAFSEIAKLEISVVEEIQFYKVQVH